MFGGEGGERPGTTVEDSSKIKLRGKVFLRFRKYVFDEDKKKMTQKQKR